jgi:hypothetical protein
VTVTEGRGRPFRPRKGLAPDNNALDLNQHNRRSRHQAGLGEQARLSGLSSKKNIVCFEAFFTVMRCCKVSSSSMFMREVDTQKGRKLFRSGSGNQNNVNPERFCPIFFGGLSIAIAHVDWVQPSPIDQMQPLEFEPGLSQRRENYLIKATDTADKYINFNDGS